MLRATGHTVTGQTFTVEVADPSQWRPVSLAPPAGAGAIDYVDLRAEGADVGVDDLALSTAPQPDSAVSSGPPARTEVTTATFDFAANRPGRRRLPLLARRRAPSRPVRRPVTLTGLAPGAHTFRVATVDGYGAVDATPAEHDVDRARRAARDAGADGRRDPVVSGDSVTIDFGAPGTRLRVQRRRRRLHAVRVAVHRSRPRPRPAHRSTCAPSTPTGARTRRRSATPSRCASTHGAGATEADLDRDRIPDSQETLPLGNVPPVAGVRTLAHAASPARSTSSCRARRGLQQAGPLPGFVPLKGIAALPVGTIVDARRGTLALQSAGDGRAATDRGGGSAARRSREAIFRIRQAKLRRAALRARPIPTSLVLVSAPDAGRGCRCPDAGQGRRALAARAARTACSA